MPLAVSPEFKHLADLLPTVDYFVVSHMVALSVGHPFPDNDLRESLGAARLENMIDFELITAWGSLPRTSQRNEYGGGKHG